MRRLLLALLFIVPISAGAADSFPTGRLYYRSWIWSKPSQLWVATLRSGKIVKRTQIKWVWPKQAYPMGPFFSPDGKRIVFQREDDYFVQELGKPQVKRLDGIPQWSKIQWAPDSSHILVSKSDQTSKAAYTLIDILTGERKEIEGRYHRADWTPDGKTLLMTSVDEKGFTFVDAKTLKTLTEPEVDRQMGPCFRVALKVGLVPDWKHDMPWSGLEFSPSRRLAVYTLIDPRENSFNDDGNVPTMASYLHFPMYTILRDAKAQRGKIDIGDRNWFIPLAWSKDERTIIGTLYDNHSEFAIVHDGKMRCIDLGPDNTMPLAFYPG